MEKFSCFFDFFCFCFRVAEVEKKKNISESSQNAFCLFLFVPFAAEMFSIFNERVSLGVVGYQKIVCRGIRLQIRIRSNRSRLTVAYSVSILSRQNNVASCGRVPNIFNHLARLKFDKAGIFIGQAP